MSVVMSKVKFKENKARAAKAKAKPPGPAPPAQKNKKKKYFKDTRKKKQGRPKPVQAPLAPPVDPQQFSANWKALLEIMKANPEQKTEKHKSDSTKKLPPKESTKPCPTSSQTEGGKPAKTKSPSSKETVAQAEDHKKKSTKKRKETRGIDERQPAKKKAKGERDEQQPAKRKAKGERDEKQPAKRKAKGERDEQQPAKRKKGVTDGFRQAKEKAAPERRPPTDADLWFDDVDADDIEAAVGKEAADVVRRRTDQKKAPQDPEESLVKTNAFTGLTRAVAMDCEMVGVGPDGEDSILARVSIVNLFGKLIYDRFVKPTEEVTDYRTAVSGVRPEDVKDGEEMNTVQKEVGEILEGRILVGHAIHNDLKVLFLDHPKKKIRDTQKYKPFRQTVKSSRPSLKVLCKEVLNVKVQQGEHSSIQDAQATMRLYTMVKKQWEAEIKASRASGAEVRKPRRAGQKPNPSKDM